MSWDVYFEARRFFDPAYPHESRGYLESIPEALEWTAAGYFHGTMNDPGVSLRQAVRAMPVSHREDCVVAGCRPGKDAAFRRRLNRSKGWFSENTRWRQIKYHGMFKQMPTPGLNPVEVPGLPSYNDLFDPGPPVLDLW